jgi:hypothetical protein
MTFLFSNFRFVRVVYSVWLNFIGLRFGSCLSFEQRFLTAALIVFPYLFIYLTKHMLTLVDEQISK